MSYTIYVTPSMYDNLCYRNLSLECIKENDLWEEVGYTKEEIESDDFMLEAEERFNPIHNCHHLLQGRPLEISVAFVTTKIPGVVVSAFDEIEAFTISLTSSGMDMSESVELAYYILDGISPVRASNIYYLPDDLKELLLWCREQNRPLSFMEIDNKFKEIRSRNG